MNALIAGKKKQQGMGLIEVLVAAVIIAIGLMGLAGLQARSLQMNQSAHFRSQANYYAYEIVDAMRMNRRAAEKGEFDFAMGNKTAPTGDSMPDQALARWINGITTTLPMDDNGNTGGSVAVNDTLDGLEATVTVAWFDERWEEGGTDADKIRQITLETEL